MPGNLLKRKGESGIANRLKFASVLGAAGFAGRSQLTRKTAVIVSNRKLGRDLSAVVDNAQFVMRFNEPNLADNMSGSHTDMPMLAVSSKALHLRLADPAFLENAALKSTKVMMLAYHPEIIRKYHPRHLLCTRKPSCI